MEDKQGQLEQMNEIFNYMKQKNTRQYALELLLSLIDNEEIRKLLVETDICRIMIREVEADNDNRDLVLQIMINLSGDELFQNKFLEYNSIYRICNLLYQKLAKEIESEKSDLKKEVDLFALEHGLIEPEKQKDNIKVKFSLEKYFIDSNSIKENNNGQAVFIEIPYYFMILTNLTINEEGQKKFLNLEDEKIKGIVFLKILEKFFDNIYMPEFDFCSNLLANATALKEGRSLLLDLEVFKIFLIHFDKMNNHKIVNILRLFRNCCFEFEKYKDQLLVYNGKLLNLIIKIFILANINEKKQLQEIGIPNIDEIYYTHFRMEQAKEEREVINDLVVDIFLILTNEPQAVEYMKEKKIINAFNSLKIRNTNDQSLSDRLFVITNYLEY